MNDSTPVTNVIAAMIASGATSRQIVAALVGRFPDLTLAKLSESPAGRHRAGPSGRRRGGTDGQRQPS